VKRGLTNARPGVTYQVSQPLWLRSTPSGREPHNGAPKLVLEAPHKVSIAKFAEAVGVTRKHMSAIINARATITAETAARIACVLGTTAQYWLNLQNAVDLYDAQERLREAARQPQPMPVFGAKAA